MTTEGVKLHASVCMPSPSSCPHSEGNPPTMGVHTSPGLHLVGLKRQRRAENQSSSQEMFLTNCGFNRVHHAAQSRQAAAFFQN